MIQTSNTRFLPRLLTLWVLLLAVTAEEGNYDSAAASPPSFLRRALQQKCNKNRCPARAPTSGGSCCYTGKNDCNYNYVYLWESMCESISCTPITTCECNPNPINRKKRIWNCGMKRRNLAAIECTVTDATPVAAQKLASSVGMSCTRVAP